MPTHIIDTGTQSISGSVTIQGLSSTQYLQQWKNTSGGTLMSVTSAGGVAIGSGLPTAGYTLDVTGSIRTTGNLLMQGSILYISNQQALTQGTNILTLGGATYFTSLIYGNNSTTKHTFLSGDVGIGTTNPNERLTVLGNLSASGIAYAGGSKLAAETFAIAMAIAVG
jgi:hypothetical protein